MFLHIGFLKHIRLFPVKYIANHHRYKVLIVTRQINDGNIGYEIGNQVILYSSG